MVGGSEFGAPAPGAAVAGPAALGAVGAGGFALQENRTGWFQTAAVNRPINLNLSGAVGVAGRYRTASLPPDAALIAPQASERSVLVARMRSRHLQTQMPPLGTRIADDEGLALVQRWIDQLSPPEESKP